MALCLNILFCFRCVRIFAERPCWILCFRIEFVCFVNWGQCVHIVVNSHDFIPFILTQFLSSLLKIVVYSDRQRAIGIQLFINLWNLRILMICQFIRLVSHTILLDHVISAAVKVHLGTVFLFSTCCFWLFILVFPILWFDVYFFCWFFKLNDFLRQ